MIRRLAQRIKKTAILAERAKRFTLLEAVLGGKQLKDFEYLIHHIETKDGKEEVHHCFLYDHIANLYQQGHLEVKGGKAFLDGKAVKDDTFHVIIGLEKTQEVAWGNAEAKEAKIKPKGLRSGMTLKQKAKVW